MTEPRKTLDFDRLPLIEVAARLSIDRSQAIPVGYPLVRAVADSLGGEWQFLGENLYELPPGSNEPASPMAGVRFRRPGEGIVAAIQTDLVAVYWFAGEAAYPRFPVIEERLAGIAAMLETQLGRKLSATVANVAYANDVTDEPGSPIPDVLSKPWRLPPFAPDGRPYRMEVVWPDEGLDVRVSLHRSQAAGDESSRYHLVTACGLWLGETSPADGVRKVHDRLIELFDELLSSEVKQRWQRR